MAITLAESTLVKQIEQWGQETNRPVEKILETAVHTWESKNAFVFLLRVLDKEDRSWL